MLNWRLGWHALRLCEGRGALNHAHPVGLGVPHKAALFADFFEGSVMPGSGWFRARVVVPAVLAVCVIAGLGLKMALPTVKTRPPENAQDWPQFLGPHGTGVSDETDV